MATSNNSITDRILVRADALNPDFPKDAQTLREISLKPHDDVEIAVALMRGENPVDSSQIARIRIEIFDIGARNAPEPREAALLFEKSSTDIRAVSQSCDNNATFALTAEENAFSAGAKWLRICAFSPAGKRTTFAQGWINVENSYDTAIPAPVVPVGEKALTESTASDIFLKKTGNLAELADKAQARENLDVMSAAEVNSAIATVAAQKADVSHTHAQYALQTSLSETDSGLSDLRRAKQNCGQLYLNGGYGFTNCKPTFGAAQSLLFTYEVSETELDSAAWCIIGNLHIWSSQKGFGFAKNTSNKIQCGFNWSGNTTGRAFIEANTTAFADGKPHAWALICGKDDTSGFFKLYCDGVLIGSKTSLALFNDFIPTYGFYFGKSQVSGAQDSSAKGRLSRVAFFNFDVSVPDALYSLADYQTGKSIPPTLNLMAQDVLTLKESDVPVLTQSTYNLGDLALSAVWEDGYLTWKAGNTATITAEQASKALSMSFVYALSSAIPQGAQVEVSFDDWAFNTELFNQSGISANPVNQRYYGWFTLGTAKNSAIANTENIGHGETLESKNFKFTSTVKTDKLYILPYNFTLKSSAEQEIAAGTVFAKVKGLKVKVNGAALNLENRLNSAQVRDISAGANHANIIGNITADDTRNPAQSNYKLSWSAGQSNGIYCGANSAVDALAGNSFNRIFVRSDSASSVNFKVGGASSATQYSSSSAVSGGSWAQLDITTSDASRLYFTPTAALPSAVNLNVIIETRSIN
mgnify:CR=1 FL=1